MLLKILQKIKQKLLVYQNYNKILKDNKAQKYLWNPQKPTVVFYWTKLSMYPYQYALMQYFAMSGYNVLLKKNILWLGAMTTEFQKMMQNIPNFCITNKNYANPNDTLYITDDKKNIDTQNWKKSIYFDANIFTISTADFSKYWLMPYPMNPQMYALKNYENLPKYRQNKRHIKLFFSGNQDAESYTNPVLTHFFSKMNRIETIQTLLDNLTNEQKVMIEGNNLDTTTYQNAFVLNQWSWTPKQANNLQKRVSNQDWLQTLSYSDFFLGCAGVNQPVCHNIIEAMSVGTVPVLEYAEYFAPVLEHKKNAIIFNGRQDLIEKIKEILAMNPEEIATLRHNVITYYEEHLSPITFVKKTAERKDKKHEHLYIFAESASHEVRNKR